MNYIMKKNLLVISDDKSFHSIIEAVFKGRYTVFHAESATAAQSFFSQNPINLLLLTSKIKEAGKTRPQDALRFLDNLRKSGGKGANLPAIFLAGDVKPEVIAKAHKCNVSDIIKLPFEPIAFENKVEDLLIKFAPPPERPDPVTGLPKRRLGEERVSDMLNKGKKGALMLVDMDHYSFLSTDMSDEAMITCRDIIKKEIDENAVFSVVKGGGFLLFIPGLRDREKIEKYAENLIEKITRRIRSEKVYVSIGLAVSDRHGKNYEDLYFACDRGLGEARKLGKNIAKFYSW